jgi:hypothetical protein
VGDLAIVELKTGMLLAFGADAKLEQRWKFPLNGAWLAGDPIVQGDQIVIALTDGRVLWLSPQSGEISRAFDAGQQLSFGPQLWGTSLIVGSLDGTVIDAERGTTAASPPEGDTRNAN